MVCPQISVIIATYKPSSYLITTIESIKKFFKEYSFEILVVEDGSSNESQKILGQIKEDKVSIIHLHHHGVSHARNIGIELSKGSYIMFCDDDDKLLGTCEKLSLGQDDIICFSKNCSTAGRHAGRKMKEQLSEEIFNLNRGSSVNFGYNGASYSKLFRTSFLNSDKHRIRFNEKLNNSEDLLFNLNSIWNSKFIYSVKNGIYQYNQNPCSVTHSFDKRLLSNHIEFINEVTYLQKQFGFSNNLLERIKSLYLYQLVFRFFSSQKVNSLDAYLIYRHGVNQSRAWNTELSRLIERITIYLINYVSIRGAVCMAKIYLAIKHAFLEKKGKSITL